MTPIIPSILVLLAIISGAFSDQLVTVEITTVENRVGNWSTLTGPCGDQVWSNGAGSSISYSFTGTGWAVNVVFTAPGRVLVNDGVSTATEFEQDTAGTSCTVPIQHQNMAYGQYTVTITIISGAGGITSFQYWTFDETQWASVSSTSMAAIAGATAALSQASAAAQQSLSVASLESMASVSITAYVASVVASVTSVQATASLSSAAAAASSSAANAPALAKPHISTSTIVGIAIGGIAGFLILIVFLLLWRRTKKRDPRNDDAAEYRATVLAAAPAPAAASLPFVSPREPRASHVDTSLSSYAVEKALLDTEDAQAAPGVERLLPEGSAQAIVGATPTTSANPIATPDSVRPLPSPPIPAITPPPPPYQDSQHIQTRSGSI